MGVVETAARQWFRAACPGALQRLGRHNWEIRVLLFLYGFGFEHWVDQWESITVASHHTHHTLPLRGITGRASSASLDYRHAAARLWGSSNHASIAIG